MSTRWPYVVGWLLDTLPTIWTGVDVYDGDPVSQTSNPNFVVVGHSGQDAGSGNYIRQVDPSMLIDDAGTVRLRLITQTGDVDPAGARLTAFSLADSLWAAIAADQTLGGVLGAAGTASLSVDIQSASSAGGVKHELVLSLNYSSLTT